MKKLSIAFIIIINATYTYSQSLKLQSGFESGVNLTYGKSGSQMVATLSGNDDGYDWSNLPTTSAASNPKIYHLIPNTESQFYKYAYASIVNIMDTLGNYTNALRFEVRDFHAGGNTKYGAHDRTQLNIEYPDLESGIYSSYLIRFQDNLESIMSSSGSWRVISEIREGGSVANEHRITLGIEQSGTGLVWKLRCDEYISGKINKVWSYTNTDIAVPIGTAKWFNLEMYAQQQNDSISLYVEVNNQLLFEINSEYVGFTQTCISYQFIKLYTDTTQYSLEEVYQYYDDVVVYSGLPEDAFNLSSSLKKTCNSKDTDVDFLAYPFESTTDIFTGINHIKVDKDSHYERIEILDVCGKIIKSTPFTLSLDIQSQLVNYPKGIYYLRFYSKKDTKTLKIAVN